jgi:flagellar protein FliO/FliZ
MIDLVLTGAALIAATVFVLVLAWVCLRLLRRFQRGAGAGEAMGYVRAIPVGPRERVTLIRFRGEILMLGVAAGGVSLLARYPDDAGTDDLDPLGPVGSSGAAAPSPGRRIPPRRGKP